jgi:hypothetical protein
MQIHFCDLCNESVPESDLEQGRAFLRKGRVVCASCDAAMSAASAGAPTEVSTASVVAEAPPNPPAPLAPATASAPAPAPHVHPHAHPHRAPSNSGAGIAVGLVAILLVFVLGYWIGDQLSQVQHRLGGIETTQNDQKGELAAGRDRLVRAQTDIADDAERRALDLRATLDAKVAAAAEQDRAAAARVDTQLAAFQGKLDELQRAFGQVGRHDAELVALGKRCATLSDELAELRRTLEASAAESAQAAASEGASGAHTPKPAQPAWFPLLEQLNSKRASERWQAMTALAETRDPAVAPHLVPGLRDEDVFNRMATARMLGDLASPVAVPALIETLNDANASVRDAAYLALRSITKRDFPFNAHSDDEADRAKKVKVWEDWWKKDGSKLLGA